VLLTGAFGYNGQAFVHLKHSLTMVKLLSLFESLHNNERCLLF